jgi:hypothetical protein
MQTPVRLALGLVAAGFMSAAGAATTPFSGALSAADPVFNRPLSGAPPTGLSGVGTGVSYDLLPFFVTANASYTIETLSASFATGTPDDTFIVLYQNSFSAAAPLTNALVADDDAGVGFLSLATANLTAGTQYFLVVTSFANGQFGNYTGSISALGNATAILGVVPEPSTSAMMLAALGLGGLVAARRKRQAAAEA